MAFCGSCGSPLDEGIRFCGVCGAPAPEPPPTPPLDPQPTPAPDTQPTPVSDPQPTPEPELDEPIAGESLEQEPLADEAPTPEVPDADSTIALRYCPRCGHPTETPVAYCARCGAPMAAAAGVDAPVDAAAAAVTEQLPPPEETAVMPAAAATAVLPPPGGYGPPAPPVAGTVPGGYGPPQSGPVAPPPRSQGVKPTLIAVAIVAVALIALVTTAVLTAGGGDDAKDSGGSGGATTTGGTTGGATTTGGTSPSPGAGDLSGQITALLAPVSEAQTAANEVVAAAEASEESLGEIRAAGEALVSAVTAAEDTAADLPREGEADQVIVTALVTGLGALGDYADALAALPSDPAELTAATATTVAAAGQKATDALEGFATVGGETTAAIAEGLVPPEAYDQIEALAGAQANDAAMKAYLKKVEALLKKSGAGREALVKAVNGVGGRTLSPKEAGKLTDAAYENRKAILKGVKALDPPGDARARQVKKHFRDAMALSLKADTAYAYWVLYAHDEYYRSPEGYKGPVAQTADYKAGVRWSTRASAAKVKLLKVYNKLAKAYGMKHDWTEVDV